MNKRCIAIDVRMGFETTNPDTTQDANDAGRAFTEWLERCPSPEAFSLRFTSMAVQSDDTDFIIKP